MPVLFNVVTAGLHRHIVLKLLHDDYILVSKNEETTIVGSFPFE